MVKDQVCSSKSLDLLGSLKKKINPVTYSLKTLKTYLASTKGGTSQSCSLKWMKSGTMSNGTFSTQPKSSLNTGKEYSLSDILEDDVPEKYFLSSQKAKQSNNEVKQAGNLTPGGSFGGNPQVGRVYGIDGIAPTLSTMQGGGQEPKALTKAKSEFGRMGQQAIETVNSNNVTPGDTINPYYMKVDKSKVSPTLTTRPEGMKTAILPITKDLRIRKLTPHECWHLQGFPDLAFSRARQAGLSDSQLYKQAGNSVTVPVIKAIAEKMELEDKHDFK